MKRLMFFVTTLMMIYVTGLTACQSETNVQETPAEEQTPASTCRGLKGHFTSNEQLESDLLSAKIDAKFDTPTTARFDGSLLKIRRNGHISDAPLISKVAAIDGKAVAVPGIRN